MTKKRILTAAAALTLAVFLTGCGSMEFVFSPQELYSLPELPAKYTELNRQINAILEGGAEYAAPTSGANIQPVQLADLDGDGREEAVAFFRKSDDDKPLKIYIFSTKGGDNYEQSAVIEGSGTSVYSVVYSDLDGDGRVELIVGWKVNAELQALSVYTLRDRGPEELLRSVSYVKYAVADMNRDEKQELVVLRADEEGDGLADYYGWQDGELALQSPARISMTMAELSQQGRLTLGKLAGETPALFVTGVTDQSSAITDVLAVRNGELTNIVLSELTGVSGEVWTFCGLYPTDINSDGLTEIPCPVRENEEGSVQRVDWRRFDLDGNGTVAVSTYHSMEDSWYLNLPENWLDAVYAERNAGSGENAVTFYALENGRRGAAVLRVSAITGASREVKATRGNRFLLSRQKTTIYTAELPEAGAGWSRAMTADQVREAFKLIAPEWTAGDN